MLLRQERGKAPSAYLPSTRQCPDTFHPHVDALTHQDIQIEEGASQVVLQSWLQMLPKHLTLGRAVLG
jgi:hypothetical protein